MSRYQTLTYSTSSIGAGASSIAGDTDKSIGPSLVDIVKLKVVPDFATGTFDVRIYKNAAQTQLLAYYPAVTPALYDPMDDSSGSPVEALEGSPLVFEDTDATGDMHIKITNNDTSAHVYTVTVEYEERPSMASDGTPTFRNASLPFGRACKYVATQVDKTSNTTLAALTDLSISLTAGKKYAFTCLLHMTDGGGGGGVKIDFNGGAATATTYIADVTIQTVAAPATVNNYRAAALNSAYTLAASGVCKALIHGFILVNTGGTFMPEFAQNSSNVTTSSVLVGSTLEVQECL